MKYKLVPNFFFLIVSIIVGSALFKQFNFEKLTFEKPALAIVYSITLFIAIGFMIRKSKQK